MTGLDDARLGRRRRWLALAGLASLVGAVAVACGSSGSSGTGGAEGPPRPEPVGEVVDLSEPGVHELSDPPLAGDRLWGAVQVVVDGEVVLWGGVTADGPYGASSPGRLRNDGAVLSLVDGRWTEMPAAPFDEGLYDAAGFWDGTEVIVLGTECEGEVPPATDGSPPACPKGPAAAAFDPEAWRWRRLEAPPIPSNEYYDERVLDRSVAVGGDGDGVGTVTFGFDADSITWDRSSDSWGTVAPPFGDEAEWVDTCADPVLDQVVALPGRQPGPGPTELRVLAAGADAWGEPVAVETGLEVGPSCGDGYLTYSGLVIDGLQEAHSESIVVDVATGETTPGFEDTPGLRYASIAGPWLTARSQVTIGDVEGKDDPKPVDIRLVRGGETVEIPDDGLLPDFGSGLYLPHLGLLTTRDEESGVPHLVVWRAPPELQP